MFTSCFLYKIERKRKQKRNRKKTNYSYHYHYLLGYYLKQRSVLPVSATICKPDFPYFCRRTPPHLCIITWVFLFVKTSGPTTKAAGCEVLLQVVLCKVRGQCISQENRVGHEQILYQADQKFRTKNFFIFDFLKDTNQCLQKYHSNKLQ